MHEGGGDCQNWPMLIVRSAPLRRHYLVAAVLATLFVAYGSWVPLRPQSLAFEQAWEQFRAVLTSTEGTPGRIDFCTNVLLFVPLGFLWVAALATDTRSWLWRAFVAPVVLLGCAALSLTVEFGQLWVNRTPSRFDVYAQLIGAAAGITGSLIVGPRATGWLRSFTRERRRGHRIDWVLKAYYGALVLSSLIPLDLTLHPFDLYDKYKRGQIVIVPFAGATLDYEQLLDWLFAVLLSVPVGALGVRLAGRTSDRAAALARGILIGVGLIAAIELAQLFVLSRYTETGDVILGSAGVLIGAGLMALAAGDEAFRDAGRRRGATPALLWLALAFIWLIVPCLFAWAPFEFTADRTVTAGKWDDFFGVPFYSLYQTPQLNAFGQLLRKFLLFLPFGLLLAAALRRLPGRSPTGAPALGAAVIVIGVAAFAIEIGQVFLPSRYPDLTDALLMACGGLFGLWLAFRLSDAEHRERSPQLILRPLPRR